MHFVPIRAPSLSHADMNRDNKYIMEKLIGNIHTLKINDRINNSIISSSIFTGSIAITDVCKCRLHVTFYSLFSFFIKATTDMWKLVKKGK